MNKTKPLLGLCPIGKFVFSNEDAIKHKRLIQKKLCELDIAYVDLDDIVEDGLVKHQNQVDKVIEYFKQKDISSLFVPHCNFGTEGAVGTIAKKLNLPTLLWGPRDANPMADGTRLRDTLCGLLASSKVLYKLKVPFTYIENCWINDADFEDGVRNFLKAANVADVFRNGVRIGHIGQRIDFLWSTIINESDLLERFNIEVMPIDMVSFIKAAKDRALKDKLVYLEEINGLKANMQIEDLDNDAFVNVLAVRDQMMVTGQEYGVEGFAIQDFLSLINEMGAYCVYADCVVADQYSIGYESDIHGAISDILLRRATLNTAPAFLTDITIRHPDNDNAVLLWHFGAPLSMKHPNSQVRIGRHWILPGTTSGMVHFKLKDGQITIARFDGDQGNYKLAFGDGNTINGPDTLNNYAWMEVENWPKWERLLIEGPFMHHVAMAYGDYSDVLVEACKFVPWLEPVYLK